MILKISDRLVSKSYLYINRDPEIISPNQNPFREKDRPGNQGKKTWDKAVIEI